MRDIFDAAVESMPAWCDGLALELHDIQFQLCEFDKYERIRLHERGKVTRYTYLPPGAVARACMLRDDGGEEEPGETTPEVLGGLLGELGGQ